MYVQRFLQPTLLEQMAATPVVIVEGARAVGKTSLLRELRDVGRISASFSMTDSTQLGAASANPLAWLRSLPTPFAIDEAQLLPNLPLALKALLDETNESVRCVLTGSAAIGLSGLGGTDPLARRASRMTLEPLTEAELAATSDDDAWSVVDQLFDGDPAVGVSVPIPQNWEDQLIFGGLPRYRVMLANRRGNVLHRQVEQDIRALLTDDVLPGEKKDWRIARDILTHLLMHPGGEINATSISRSVGVDVRTVNRYIDILEQRFLVHEVANFHRPSKKSPRSTAKGYPADSALSGAVLLSTDRRMSDSTVRGGMMEAHVVQQIKAHLGWAENRVNLTHWRENKNGRTSEVDLVLQDSKGRLVAIEIKASGAISSSHFKGIRAFKNFYGERFHRGFVITTGEQPVAFDDDLWVIPVTSLSIPDLWVSPGNVGHGVAGATEPTSETKEADPVEALEEARLFISYSHQDQNSSTGGDIRRFATDVVDALEGIHGRTVQLFIDTKDVRWGDDLWSRLDEELQSSTFLMPFVTPRYLRSDGCRREFTNFSEATQRNNSEQLLLPLIWIMPPALRSRTLTDPIVERLNSTLHLDVTDARRAEPGSAEYGNLVELVAERLEEVITTREAAPSGGLDKISHGQVEEIELEPGLYEYLAALEELVPEAETALQRFLDDFIELAKEFEQVALGLHAQSPTQLRANLVRVSSSLRQPNERLTASAGAATKIWDKLLTKLNRGVNLYSEINPASGLNPLTGTLSSMAQQLQNIDTADLEGVAHQMPKMSSKLVPTSKALLSAVSTIRSMEASLHSWLSAVSREQ